MVCTYCGGKTKVTNSRSQSRNNQIWRRRACLNCKLVFTTHEAVDLKSTVSVSKDNSVQPFLSDLLYTDLLLAMSDRKDCYTASREVAETIIRKLLVNSGSPVFTTKQISETALSVLRRFDHRSALRYTAEHPSLQ